ncbi:hypothetical protein N657DRAFT_295253 [Parathielavia appendiculata]|uniref:Uncharacterized protein n=1 Tax=Parathielavia appendiculata TaxID=2587402 RepID=A0AAN6U5D9_9PEZI|nr:hypothetical protein N657DRAFT_295253 [Parathielavia appendiculata]
MAGWDGDCPSPADAGASCHAKPCAQTLCTIRIKPSRVSYEAMPSTRPGNIPARVAIFHSVSPVTRTFANTATPRHAGSPAFVQADILSNGALHPPFLATQFLQPLTPSQTLPHHSNCACSSPAQRPRRPFPSNAQHTLPTLPSSHSHPTTRTRAAPQRATTSNNRRWATASINRRWATASRRRRGVTTCRKGSRSRKRADRVCLRRVLLAWPAVAAWTFCSRQPNGKSNRYHERARWPSTKTYSG